MCASEEPTHNISLRRHFNPIKGNAVRVFPLLEKALVGTTHFTGFHIRSQ